MTTLNSHITSDYIKTLIPTKDKEYTPWGNYDLIKKFIKSPKKFNVYITGLSGCGKTKSIEQACAELKRSLIIVPITSETTESDLIGKYVLVKGDMVWQNGAVIEAMLTDSVVVLDEVDKGTSELMCLQGILNGEKSYYIKALGQQVTAGKNFQVFATANTKGSGDEKGIFNTSNILDGAFMDRFHVMLEQNYPNKETETKILQGFKTGISNEDIDILTECSTKTRTLFEEDAIDDVISTRQLINIIQLATTIFNDAEDPLWASMEVSFNRFTEASMEAIRALYETLKNPSESTEDEDDEIKFEIEGDIPDFLDID